MAQKIELARALTVYRFAAKKKKIKEIKENSQTVGGHVCKPVLTVLVLII